MQIRNELLYTGSQINGYIAIRDQLNGAAAPSGRVPIPESPSGFPYATSDIRDYSYYGSISINIPNVSYTTENENELYVDKSTLFNVWGTNIKNAVFHG